MKANLLQAALEVVPNPQILVNMISRRVRQLSFGHRPLVEFAPGLGFADIAFLEISQHKLTYESAPDENAEKVVANIVRFQEPQMPRKKAA